MSESGARSFSDALLSRRSKAAPSKEATKQETTGGLAMSRFFGRVITAKSEKSTTWSNRPPRESDLEQRCVVRTAEVRFGVVLVKV
jgi:hypothetical protein